MFWLLPLLAPIAPPPTCASSVDDFEVTAGGATVTPGAACGEYVLSTNGSTATFSYAQMFVRREVSVPYEASVTWRRLDGVDGSLGSLELHYLGGGIFVTPGKWLAYTTEAASESHPLPGHRVDHWQTLTVRQLADRLDVMIDGKLVGTAPVPPKVAGERVAIALKGPRGVRSRMVFRDLRVRPLTGP